MICVLCVCCVEKVFEVVFGVCGVSVNFVIEMVLVCVDLLVVVEVLVVVVCYVGYDVVVVEMML